MMSDFIMSVRSIVKGEFSNEPGKTYFLAVPESADDIKPSKKMIVKKSDWFKSVLSNAVIEQDENGEDCGDILVFIHGYNNSQKTLLKRHRQIKTSMAACGYKGEVVSFDWPSAKSSLNYLEDRCDAKATALRLVTDCIKAFSVMQSATCKINAHLLAHSTGAYVVREAFDDADDRPAVAAFNWTVSQILLIGADISAKSMGAGNAKSSSIYRHCVRLTNYSNPYDSVLKLSNVKRVGVAPRAGRVGLPAEVPGHAVNVNCGVYYQANAETLHPIGSKSHSWYIGNETFTKDMLCTIRGDIDRYQMPTRMVDNGKLYLKA